jgi:hypothetical protein
LQARRDAGETLAAIGEKFGVSHVTVVHWISGKRAPSRMTLVLAGTLCCAPVEMAPGLPPFSGVRTPERISNSGNLARITDSTYS